MTASLIFLIWIICNQHNNTYHHSINKKLVNADYSALTEQIETNLKASNFKVNDRVRITKCKSIFSNGYPENFYHWFCFEN